MRSVIRTAQRLLLLTILTAAAPHSAHALDSCQIPTGATRTINEHSVCRRITNSHASGAAILVPTKSAAEWSTGANAFLNATPAGVTVSACAAGGPVTHFLNFEGARSWTVPSDWNNSNNSIHVIGAGGTAGGGGGAYSRILNVTRTPGTAVSFSVGHGGLERHGRKGFNGGGGGGGYDAQTESYDGGDGGIGGSEEIWDQKYGPGGGGGGTGGRNTGGNGGLYGGGGGRSAVGAQGIIAIEYSSKWVFLTTPLSINSTWTVPADWVSSDNKIHTIGGGGGNIGGGGGYSRIQNISLTPGATVTYRVGGEAADTWFNGAACGTSSVCAKGGAVGVNPTPGQGGQASQGVGSTKYSGGTGGTGFSSTGPSGGGGGAAGPNGNGATGGNAGSANQYGGGGGGANGGAAGVGTTGQGGHNRLGVGGGVGNSSLAVATDTFFGAATCAASLVCAKAGVNGSLSIAGGTGGLASGGVGTLKTSGGAAGDNRGAGGGGAGGPNGNGAVGGDSPGRGGGGGGGANGGAAGASNAGDPGANGGNGRSGSGGGVAGGALPIAGSGGGGQGGGYENASGSGAAMENIWIQSSNSEWAGPGGGGGGGANAKTNSTQDGGSGASGGRYGGGGGNAGNGSDDQNLNNPGGDGIIVIQYTPAAAASCTP